MSKTLKDCGILALDGMSLEQAFSAAEKTAPHMVAFKVGYELFTRAGPEVVRGINERGGRVFLDLKFKDIPQTVQNAVEAAVSQGVWMLNLHADSPEKAMRLASEAKGGALLIAVTVLTAFTEEEYYFRFNRHIADAVNRLTETALKCGCDGVVCSPREVAAIKKRYSCVTVVPGARSASTPVENDDQARVLTFSETIATGADYLVIGRPITKYPEEKGGMIEAIRLIDEELATI